MRGRPLGKGGFAVAGESACRGGIIPRDNTTVRVSDCTSVRGTSYLVCVLITCDTDAPKDGGGGELKGPTLVVHFLLISHSAQLQRLIGF